MPNRRPLRLLAVPLLALPLLAGCGPAQGHSSPPGGKPAGGAEHVLRFQVGPGGSISAPVAMKATEGADLKLKLDNRSSQKYALRVTGPKGEKRAGVDVAGHHLGQTNFVFARTGTYQVGIYRGGSSTPQRKFPIIVRGG